MLSGPRLAPVATMGSYTAATGPSYLAPDVDTSLSPQPRSPPRGCSEAARSPLRMPVHPAAQHPCSDSSAHISDCFFGIESPGQFQDLGGKSLPRKVGPSPWPPNKAAGCEPPGQPSECQVCGPRAAWPGAESTLWEPQPPIPGTRVCLLMGGDRVGGREWSATRSMGCSPLATDSASRVGGPPAAHPWSPLKGWDC